MDASQPFFEDLSQSSRRRLWLLQHLMQKVEPEEALRLAERMESFVLGGSFSFPSDAPASDAHPDHAAPPPMSAPPAASGPSLRNTAPKSTSGNRLLEGEALRQFTEALMGG